MTRSPFRLSRLATLLTFSLIGSHTAYAEELPGAGEDLAFAQSSQLSEGELDDLRGGFMINGIEFTFEYFRQVSVVNPQYGINEVLTSTLTSGDIKSTNSNLQGALIIQNNLPGSVIDALQVLRLQAPGSLNAAALAQMTNRMEMARRGL